MFPPNWRVALARLGAAKKPCAIRLGDILREAADTALHVSPHFPPLLLLPEYVEGDLSHSPRTWMSCGAGLLVCRKVALQARCEAFAGPRGVCVLPQGWEGIQGRVT